MRGVEVMMWYPGLERWSMEVMMVVEREMPWDRGDERVLNPNEVD